MIMPNKQEGLFPTDPVIEDGTEQALSQNKVGGGTRLDKFLAKIAGEDVGELTPKTETEKRLNKIAEGGGGSSSGGGVFVVHIDGNNAFDKTMGEIQEAWARNDRIDIIINDIYHVVPIILKEVHYEPREDPPAYSGNVRLLGVDNEIKIYAVNEATEADALNAYPSH